MQQGDLIEIEITDLNHTGEGEIRSLAIAFKLASPTSKKVMRSANYKLFYKHLPIVSGPAASSLINVVVVNGNTSMINFSAW